MPRQALEAHSWCCVWAHICVKPWHSTHQLLITLYSCSCLDLFLQIEDSGYISLINVNSSVNTSDIAFLLQSTPYAPQDFPLNSSDTILSGIDWGAVIAPYWYDVDTRGNGSGRIYYKDVTRGTSADLIGEIDSLAASYLCGFTTIWALIITWDHVGYFAARSDLVSSDGQTTTSLYLCVYTCSVSYNIIVLLMQSRVKCNAM